MDDKQNRALKRLLKRLSAVRQTLRSDERRLLDAMVSGSFAEVEGHAYKLATRPEKEYKGEGLMLKKGNRPAAKPEVEAHAMEATKAKDRAKPEVEAHAVEATKAKDRAKPEVEAHAVEATKAKDRAKPEVEAHVLKEAAKPRAKPEVEAHVLKEAAKPKAKPEVEAHVLKEAAKPKAKPEKNVD